MGWKKKIAVANILAQDSWIDWTRFTKLQRKQTTRIIRTDHNQQQNSNNTNNNNNNNKYVKECLCACVYGGSLKKGRKQCKVIKNERERENTN